MALGKDPVGEVWRDGKFIPPEKATFPFSTHSGHYGTNVFEGIRFYETENGTAVFAAEKHIERLYRSAQTVRMNIPFTSKEINEAIIETVRRSGLREGYIRPIAYFGRGLGVNPLRGEKPSQVHLDIAVLDWGAYLGDNSARVMVSSVRRLHPSTFNPETKIGGHYFNSEMASTEASERGYDEALQLDYNDCVSEGAGENIFIVSRGRIYTPKKGNILPGITRRIVIDLLKEREEEIIETNLTLEEVLNADEAFFTGTAAEIHPIHSVNDQIFKHGAPGPITAMLKDSYQDVVRGRNPKYTHWLTRVEQHSKSKVPIGV